MNTTRIRPCEPADVDAVINLWSESDDLGGSTNDGEAVLRRLAIEDGLYWSLKWTGNLLER